MVRPKGVMEMDLYRKIIDDAVDIPIIDHLTLNGLGEPLLDKHLIERIVYARKKMAAIEIDFYTNGSFLSEEKAIQLKESGVSRVFISLNAVREITRQEIMGTKDFDKVVNGIHALKAQGVPISVLMTITKDLMEMEDMALLNAMFPGETMPHLEGNWAGRMFTPRVKQHSVCGRVIGQIMVLWDGRVALCCQDSEGHVVFGNLKDQTIREVYNSPEYVRYREFHMEGKRSQLKLCDVCTTN